ncbi:MULTISPECIES: DUF397 domain-containing protein [Streptomyces]|uniref:DUF397 domain-containing protein n=1 Tax=Streptomyces thermoviolaceus subsp. thermoviolaceus TaxID=66860 RepID=A0ABX0YSC1_STRTL|nr:MULTISPECIES: DUF397 domain-containing protein [Streptomyces]WTD48716.1 DUF397 domain-containing protein [Streptomyces thermoviolaceus]NJP15482.1 DUF397 domain-containing protein [Streptomyces thermoviolaceus subsp. thermoviolaceus]RSR96356.1 DUF397 domain-containing protein [Streptomyces sp. WAC00469]GGV69552.1 toxin [Streptomyces thermoviolaceus subsp. apingens]GHB05111.1 toxin [Streptomyces thermoviolaceus subsp. thermoviolaceus]
MRNPEDDLSTTEWHKSSYSGGGGGGGNCLEVAHWRKSTYSDNAGNCLEFAPGHPTLVPVRDSKNPDGPKLVFTAEAWSAFVSGLKP